MEDENKTDDQMLKKHIQFLEEALLDPGVRTDRESLERLLAESFIEFGSSGTVWKRKDCLGKAGSASETFISMISTSNPWLTTSSSQPIDCMIGQEGSTLYAVLYGKQPMEGGRCVFIRGLLPIKMNSFEA